MFYFYLYMRNIFIERKQCTVLVHVREMFIASANITLLSIDCSYTEQ